MSMQLNKGDLFITNGNETMYLGQGIPYTEEIEFSANENPLHLYHCNDMPEINLEIRADDLINLSYLYNMPQRNEKFTLEYSVPIMVQARWHKKARTRKKWLKRYGMKPDTVGMRANAVAGEYNPNDGTFDFESEAPEYLWRPDQNGFLSRLRIDLVRTYLLKM